MLRDKVRAAIIPCDRLVGILAVKFFEPQLGVQLTSESAPFAMRRPGPRWR